MRVKCKRPDGRGDRPAPEPIVDALCCSVHIACERGRVYLDGQGRDKERVQVGAPFRGSPPRGGAVVEVHDNESGLPYRAALKSVKSKGGLVVESMYELERDV